MFLTTKLFVFRLTPVLKVLPSSRCSAEESKKDVKVGKVCKRWRESDPQVMGIRYMPLSD